MGTHLSTLINPMLWDRADWIGILFAVERSGTQPPVAALLFRHEAAGRTVFDDLIRKIGAEDTRGLLRVAIVEGDIPGRPPGYTMHVGPYLDNTAQDAAAGAGKALRMDVVLVSRVCRVSEGPESFGLPVFKEQYARFRRCRLVPAGPRPEAFSPHSDLGIWKTDLIFRQAADIPRAGIDQD